MRRTTIALWLSLAVSAPGQDTVVRASIKDSLDGVTRGDMSLRESAESELYVDQIRRVLGQTAPAAVSGAETAAFRRTEFLAASRRVDQQLAGDAANSGTTSVASLSGVTDFVSAALESGLINRTTEGAISTFRLNASGLARFFDPQPPCFLRSEKCQPTLEQRLKALSIGAAFEQARAEAADPKATGTVQPTSTALPTGAALPGLSRAGTLRTMSLRWEFRQRKGLRHSDQQERWREAMKGAQAQAQALGNAMNRYIEALTSAPGWTTWKETSAKRLEEIARSQDPEAVKLERMFRAYRDDAAAFVSEAGESLTRTALTAMEGLTEFRNKRNELLYDALYPAAASLEYLYQRPANQPEYSTIRLVIGKPFGQQGETAGMTKGEAPLSQFTANLALSLYHAYPTGSGAVRDVQGAVQLDRALPVKSGSQKAVFSLGGYYQYLAQKGVLQFDNREVTPFAGIPLRQPAKILLDTKGSLFTAQAKLTFPIGNSGVNFPVAVSWANRAELVKATYTKLQFGFTFDLDKLMKAQGAKQ